MPAGCLYAPQAFIDKNPNTAQALANAIVRADKWIQAAGPGDVIKAVPESYLLGDRAVYIDAFLAAKGALSPDGMFPDNGPGDRVPRAGQHRPGDRQGQARPEGGLHERLREEGQREVPERLNEAMTGPQIIVLATPVFLALIALEFAVGVAPRAQHLPARTTRCPASAWA